MSKVNFFKEKLLDRGYSTDELTSYTKSNDDLRNSMLSATSNIDKKTTLPLVFSLPFFPQISHSVIKGAITKNWHLISEDDFLNNLFPVPPLLAYKRQKNIKDKIIRARLPNSTQENSLTEMDKENLQILLDLLQEQQSGTEL